MKKKKIFQNFNSLFLGITKMQITGFGKTGPNSGQTTQELGHLDADRDHRYADERRIPKMVVKFSYSNPPSRSRMSELI
jgi:hypothetical protein